MVPNAEIDPVDNQLLGHRLGGAVADRIERRRILATTYTIAVVISLSYGVLATEAGFTPLQAIVVAAFVFAGSAQFASLSIVAGGGAIPAALAAATLMNSRFLAMGIALAPSLPGGPVQIYAPAPATGATE